MAEESDHRSCPSPPDPPSLVRSESSRKFLAPTRLSDLVKKKIGVLSWRSERVNKEYFELDVDGARIKLNQRKNGELIGIGTGASVWNAAVVFCKWLEKQYGGGRDRGIWKDKTIVELGSGTGIAGIACAKIMKDASQYVLTDQVQVLPIIRENVQMNLKQIPALERCITLSDLTDENSTVIIAYEHRHFTQTFWDRIDDLFDTSRVGKCDMDDRFCDDDIDICILKKKK